MKFFSQYTRGKRGGFTIIEAFVGITILLVGLVGPLVLVNVNLQAGKFSRNQITAYYLAQEALETVREIRDENFLTGSNWLNNLGDCMESGKDGCRVDGRAAASQRISSCSGSDCTKNNALKMNPSTGEYGYRSSDENSLFYRYVQIEETDGGEGAIVHVHVGFNTGRYVQEYTTTDYLRNWSPR